MTPHPQQSQLTPREREAAEHVARGLSNLEIAEEMGTSIFTVKFQLQQVFKKLGVTSRQQVAAALSTEGAQA